MTDCGSSVNTVVCSGCASSFASRISYTVPEPKVSPV